MKFRLLDIFFRLIIGEEISIKSLSKEYSLSTKTISRDIAEIKKFLSQNNNFNIKLYFNNITKTYTLTNINLLSPEEVFAIIKILICTRAIDKKDITNIIIKLQNILCEKDKLLINKLIQNELFSYKDVKKKNLDLINELWNIAKCIDDKRQITITYYKVNDEQVKRRLNPVGIVFSEYYFYLLAYRFDDENSKLLYYRVDRITEVYYHKTKFELNEYQILDEGELKNKLNLMNYGDLKMIKFEYTGVSPQAILDKLPNATMKKIDNKFIFETTFYDKGIISFLLSQGAVVKILEPKELVEKMKEEIKNISKLYEV